MLGVTDIATASVRVDAPPATSAWRADRRPGPRRIRTPERRPHRRAALRQPRARHYGSGKLAYLGQAAFHFHRFSRVTLAPLSEASAISPVLVNTRATTCEEADVVSIVPFAPTFTIDTATSPPTDHPAALRNLSSPSRVMNMIMTAVDWAPAWNPNEAAAVL